MHRIQLLLHFDGMQGLFQGSKRKQESFRSGVDPCVKSKVSDVSQNTAFTVHVLWLWVCVNKEFTLFLELHTYRCWPCLWQLWHMAWLAACSSLRWLRMDRDSWASGHTGFLRNPVDLSLFWLSGLTAGVHCFYSFMCDILHWVCICSWQCR